MEMSFTNDKVLNALINILWKQTQKILKAWLFLILAFQAMPVFSEDAPVFAFERRKPRCTQNCIAFTIDIYSDGKLHYKGWVAPHGETKKYQRHKTIPSRYSSITPVQLDELIRTYDSLDWEEHARLYSKNGSSSDVGAAFISCTKCKHPERINSLWFMEIMLKNINRFATIERWMCFPKGHKEREGCWFD